MTLPPTVHFTHLSIPSVSHAIVLHFRSQQHTFKIPYCNKDYKYIHNISMENHHTHLRPWDVQEKGDHINILNKQTDKGNRMHSPIAPEAPNKLFSIMLLIYCDLILSKIVCLLNWLSGLWNELKFAWAWAFSQAANSMANKGRDLCHLASSFYLVWPLGLSAMDCCGCKKDLSNDSDLPTSPADL